MMEHPCSVEEVGEMVRALPRVRVRGGATKEPLVGGDADWPTIGMGGVSGILDYEASEYTFTAMAGTRVSEIEAALQERGQYLPFDPLLVGAGATLGGTVASGISGPGRFRYGGLRDFLLGVQFVDGTGRLVRSGGKVVKNAAGFDLSKFLVGSMGRLGILTELTFKVFPAPEATRTLRVACGGIDDAVERMAEASRARWELDALECVSGDASFSLVLRIAGPESALDPLGAEICGRWPGEVEPLERGDADAFWADARELRWCGIGSSGEQPAGRCLLRVAMTPSRMSRFGSRWTGDGCEVPRYSCGGAVAWMLADGSAAGARRIGGMPEGSAHVVLGDPAGWCAPVAKTGIHESIRTALDPDGRFPEF